MNHPSDDELLLLVYEELPESRAGEVEAHLIACAICNERFVRNARGRVATEWSLQTGARARAVRWVSVATGLATAALIAAILLTGHRANEEPAGVWPRTLEWSANAGYFAGGRAVIVIDGQLKQLEQGWSYGRP